MCIRVAICLILFSFFLSGCGSGPSDIVTGTSESPSPMNLERVVIGRLNLGLNIPDATMRLESLDGTILGSETTNANGTAFFREIQVPDVFRAVVTVPDSQVQLSAQIRGFRDNNKQARVSLLTTLADRHAQAHPEQGIEEAEKKIKKLLNIPAGVDLGIGPEGINPFFSDIALLRAAGFNGGWIAYSENLLNQAELLNQDAAGSQGLFFLLSLDQLNRPIVGLEPGLQETAEEVRSKTAGRLGIKEAVGPNLDIAYSPSISLVAGPTSLGGQFLLGVGTGLGTNILEDGINAVIGWAANQMGLNYGTSGQLQEIEEELTSLISLVESFEETQVTSDLTDEFNTLQGFFSQVQNTTGQLRDQAGSTTITNSPIAFSSTDPMTALLNALNSENYTSALTDANNNLLGQTEFLISYQNTYFNLKLGLDTPPNKQGMPWRSNHILGIVTSVFQHFSNLQVETLNLLAEQAHSYPNNPAAAVPSLRTGTLAQTLSNLKKQRQQMALYSSQWGTIVDLENGTMWWETMHSAETYRDAQDYASSFSIQVVFPDGSTRTYDDWRLPGYGDCLDLQLRGTYNPSPGDPTFTGTDTGNTVGGVPVNSKKSYPDTGQSTAGLPGLGFYQVREALDSSMNDNGKNGDMWFQYAASNGSEVVLFDDYEFRLNHGSSNVNFESKSSDINVYLLCRTFGPDNINGETNGGTLSYFDGSTLTAGEIAQWGVPTALSISSVDTAPSSISFPGNSAQGSGTTNTLEFPEGALEVHADITYTINIGGSYTMGFGSTKSRAKTAHSHQATVSTSKNTNGNPNYLAELVDWSVDNTEALYLLNLPFTRGIAIPYQATEVTLKASLLGAGGAEVSATLPYNISAASPRTLTGIVITPRNQIYGGTGAVPSNGPEAKQQYFCTGFYKDWTVADLSTQVTWQVPTNAANAQMVVDGEGATLELSQPAEANPTPYTLEITATHENTGLSDTVTVQIVPQVE